MERTKFILDEEEMPTSWYNILPDLPEPLPPEVHPGTKEPMPSDMSLPPPLFPMDIIKQEFSPEQMLDDLDYIKELLKVRTLPDEAKDLAREVAEMLMRAIGDETAEEDTKGAMEQEREKPVTLARLFAKALKK